MFVNKLKNCWMGLGTLALMVWTGTASADWALNMTKGVTPVSREVYDLHMLIFWIVTIIGAGVFGVMFWSIFHHRKSKGVKPAQFHHSTAAEIAWTIIPILILVVMAIPATNTLIKMEQTGDADITVKITGHQWKWQYEYMNEGLNFFSILSQDSNDARQLRSGIDPNSVEHYLLNVDKPVVLPVNKKIRLLTTGKDVIHSWWIPALGWKRDAVPGYINDNWAVIEQPGTYRGQCAELCGKDHAFMPIVLKAVPEEEYLAWIEQMKLAQAEAAAGSDKEFTMDELLAKGEEIYKANCVACHQVTGQGIPGTFPALDGSPIVKGGDIKEHTGRILRGKNLMPAFGVQLSDADIAAVVTYERNAWNNKTADIVQPKDVKTLR
jgi:cytochrome c oxidase, subunit II